MRSLIVEDAPGLRRALVQFLSEENFSIDEAADGEEGLRKALAWEYDARMRRDGRSDSSGSGLGLSICKSIVETHGGTLNVRSELTKGRLFEVRLPITPHQTKG